MDRRSRSRLAARRGSRPESHRSRLDQRRGARVAGGYIHPLCRLRSRAGRNAARCRTNNSDPDAYAGLGAALLWSGDVDGSVKAFETASKLGLEFTRNDSFMLGIAYLLADRSADAVRTLERSLERNQTDAYANAVLAAAYAEAGRQTDALRQAASVRELNPRFESADFGSLLRKPELR